MSTEMLGSAQGTNPEPGTTPKTSTIAAKLVAAMGDIDAVTKEGKNQAQGYNYVKAADVAQEVRKALVKHRIAFLYSVEGTERWQTDRIDKTTGNVTGTMNYVQLTIMVTFIDADSGDRVTVQGIGWGSDTGDKAPYKAMTGAIKYCLRMAFVIPDESDPENDKAEVHAEVERQKSNPSKNPSGPALVGALQASVAQETAKLTPEQRAAEDRNKLAQDIGTWSIDGNILHCKIIGIQKKKKRDGVEFLSVTFNGRLPNGANFASVFDTELYEALNAGLDKEVKLKIAIKGAYVNVEDVVAIEGIGDVFPHDKEPLFPQSGGVGGQA